MYPCQGQVGVGVIRKMNRDCSTGTGRWRWGLGLRVLPEMIRGSATVSPQTGWGWVGRGGRGGGVRKENHGSLSQPTAGVESARPQVKGQPRFSRPLLHAEPPKHATPAVAATRQPPRNESSSPLSDTSTDCAANFMGRGGGAQSTNKLHIPRSSQHFENKKASTRAALSGAKRERADKGRELDGTTWGLWGFR